ncbi:hypothetical protein [Riemerella anatipestifer]|nr:hypothetical protein [Riemerella anatipestifer]
MMYIAVCIGFAEDTKIGVQPIDTSCKASKVRVVVPCSMRAA